MLETNVSGSDYSVICYPVLFMVSNTLQISNFSICTPKTSSLVRRRHGSSVSYAFYDLLRQSEKSG